MPLFWGTGDPSASHVKKEVLDFFRFCAGDWVTFYMQVLLRMYRKPARSVMRNLYLHKTGGVIAGNKQGSPYRAGLNGYVW